MTNLQRADLTTSRKIECAAQVLVRQARGVITALGVECGLSRPEPFIASLTNADYSDFLHRLLPAGRWFQGMFADLAASLPFR